MLDLSIYALQFIFHIFLFPQIRPEVERDYLLNLSILLSGGKETNKDALSNGE